VTWYKSQAVKASQPKVKSGLECQEIKTSSLLRKQLQGLIMMSILRLKRASLAVNRTYTRLHRQKGRKPFTKLLRCRNLFWEISVHITNNFSYSSSVIIRSRTKGNSRNQHCFTFPTRFFFIRICIFYDFAHT